MADGEKAATAYTIGWQPQPGPRPVFEVFFGGARGGGKTDGMLGEWASHRRMVRLTVLAETRIHAADSPNLSAKLSN
jgi:hypothetical protein